MRSVWVCLLLAVLPAAGEERLSEPPVALYTSFQQAPPSTPVVQSLRQELESIMAPSGMHFAWRSLAGVTGSEVSAELAVITFKGSCNIDGLTPKSVRPGALGWTHVSDGVILPFADIDCDRIRLFVQKELLYYPAREREALYGRAVGRVVAHELYHIFAQTAHHGSDGVGKSAFTVQELLNDDFRFEERNKLTLKNFAARVTPVAPDHTIGTP